MTNQISVFEELRQEEILCDAVLQVNGTQFKVHKLLLCSCSSYFRTLFTDRSSSDRNVFHITNLSADILQTFIKFAYTGVVTVTEDNVFELFIAADRYCVSGITEACCKLLEEKLCPQTCINTWWFSNNYHRPKLSEKAFSYILRHFEEVLMCSEDFLELSLADLSEIIQNDRLNVREESIVFEAVLHWISHSPSHRKEHISQLLPKVRLALINYSYLNEQVLNNELVKKQLCCKTLVLMATTFLRENKTKRLPLSSLPLGQARPRVPRVVLLAIGGCENPTNYIEAYDNRANCWIAVGVGDGLTPRDYQGTVFLNGSVYCTGRFNSTDNFSTMLKYDPLSLSWNEVAPMHSIRFHASVVLLDGFIYAMGGCDGFDNLETAERYAPQTNQWTMIASMSQQRNKASSTTFDGKIYICGGFGGLQFLSSAERYDPQTNQWTNISNMSCPRSGLGVVTYGNKIYAAGGLNILGHQSSVEAYNPETNRWHPAPSMKSPRSNFGIEVLDDCLFIVGGHNGSKILHDVESFNGRTGVWLDVPPMKTPRSGLSCCAVYDPLNIFNYIAPRSPLPDVDTPWFE